MSIRLLPIISILLNIVSFTFAVPKVTPVLLGTACSNYPSYNSTTGTANSFLLQIANSDNATIDGYTSGANFNRGARAVANGYITFSTMNDPDQTNLYCVSDKLYGNVPWGVGGTTGLELVIAVYPYDAELGYAIPGSSPQLFEHYDENGIKMDGVFLGGYGNTTTWGIKYYENAGWHGQSFYYVRLLGENSQDPTTGQALSEGEFTTFIKLGS